MGVQVLYGTPKKSLAGIFFIRIEGLTVWNKSYIIKYGIKQIRTANKCKKKTERSGIKMSKNFRETLNEQLKDKEFKKEYMALELEFQIINALLDGRKEKNLTQKQLSELTGINQADISKIEKGNANPSVRTLQRLAAGMDMNVKIEFVPN